MSAGAVWAVCWQGKELTLVFISQYLVMMVLEKKFFFFLPQAEWLFLFLKPILDWVCASRKNLQVEKCNTPRKPEKSLEYFPLTGSQQCTNDSVFIISFNTLLLHLLYREGTQDFRG